MIKITTEFIKDGWYRESVKAVVLALHIGTQRPTKMCRFSSRGFWWGKGESIYVLRSFPLQGSLDERAIFGVV